MASLLPPRSGISLTEVLIAMGILTIGLLGVAAIFPVGSYYMQQSEIADRGSAIAQAAFNEAITNGTLNPENWLVWEDGSSIGPAWPPGISTRGSTFYRPFAERLRRLLADRKLSSMATAASVQREAALEFGTVFVIDPMGVASIAAVNPANGVHEAAGNAPQAGAVYPATKGWRNGAGWLNGSPPSVTPGTPWYPWLDPSGGPGGSPRWPIRRVTLAQPFRPPMNTGFLYKPLDATVAQSRFSTSDDLSLDVPAAQNKPAIQRWDLGNLDGGSVANDPLGRQSRGNYSWIVTVSPTTSEARDALATDPSAYEYEVSVVVFYKRPLAATNPSSQEADEVIRNAELLRNSERAVRASIVSTGLNGGEVLLERYPTTMPNSAWEPEGSPFNVLKTGRWVLLCGPHPQSTDARPIMVARWYRVLAIEGKDTKLDAEGNPTSDTSQPDRRLVALRGPQWPWQPAPYLSGYDDHLSNSLYVCIPAGAVAVHSKTIRLEGKSVWGGTAAMPAPGEPPRYAP